MTDLKWTDLCLLVDTREQSPWYFGDMRTEFTTLTTGDYSVKGLESLVAVERKSIPDLVACCGRERERFERELQRLKAYETRLVVVEGNWVDFENSNYRSQISPESVIASICGWISEGIPFVLAGNQTRAARIAARIMYLGARRRYRQLLSLQEFMEKEFDDKEESDTKET